MGCNPTVIEGLFPLSPRWASGLARKAAPLRESAAAAKAKASGYKMEMERRVFSLEPGQISVSIKVVDSAICGERCPWVVYPMDESALVSEASYESGIPT